MPSKHSDTRRRNTPAPFSTTVPRRALLKMYAAIFCIFAPMMILSVSSSAEQHPTRVLLVWFALSGFIAVGWAISFTQNRRGLFIVVPLQFVLVAIFATRIFPDFTPHRASLSLFGMGSVALLIAGYVAFVMFIRGEGTRGLRLQTEMDLARQIHDSLVPDIDEETTAFSVVGRSEPSGEMGGDLLAVARDAHRGTLDVYLGDVSGHGVKPGIVMAMIKSAIEMRRRQDCELHELLADVNRVLVELTDPAMFATFVALRLHEDGRVEYCHAGHPGVLHYRATPDALTELTTEGLPLGVLEDAEYATASVATEPGDVLAIYTDGLIEVFNARGEQLGWDGFQAHVKQHAVAPTLQDAVSRIWTDVRAFGSNAKQDDDQSIVLIRRKA